MTDNTNIQIPVVNAGNLYVNGLIPYFVTATTVSISSGQARDSSDVTDVFLDADITINTALFGVVNGVDAGPLTASSYYAVHVIKDSSLYNAPGGLLSLSATAPQLPSNYDTFRHIGYVYLNSSSNILSFYYIGNSNDRRFILDTALTTTVSAVGDTAYQIFSFTGKMPAVANNDYMIAIVNATLLAASAGNGAFFKAFNSSSTDGQNYIKCPAASTMAVQLELLTELDDGAMKIKWKTSSASDDLTIDVVGFEFTVQTGNKMAYTVTKLVTDAYYISSIVSRDFETVSGAQLNDGIDTLNDLIGDKAIDSSMIPYYQKYEFPAVVNQQEYFIPDLIQLDTFVFFINSIRYATRNQKRRQFRGSSRAENIASLPGIWNLEKCFGGANLSVYFTPDQNYPFEMWGQFRLSQVTNNQDLSLTLDRFYIDYLKYELACRLCVEIGINAPPDAVNQYNKYCEMIRNKSSIADLNTQKTSTMSGNGYINYAQANIGRGWAPFASGG